MNQQAQPFNPGAVPINYTLNFAQVNLLLKGMGKLPREETDGFYEQFRGHALQTLQAAEAEHNAAIEKEKADEARRNAPPEAAPAPAGDATTPVGGTD